MRIGLAGFDKRELGQADGLVGIDEAGRGCLAGPVVAAAVLCRKSFYQTSWCTRNSRMVDDSKRLSASQRQAVVERFRYAVGKDWIRIGIGLAGIEEIERFNIYHANSLAMRRALEQLGFGEPLSLWSNENRAVPALPVLIDGKPIRTFAVPHKAIVKGDGKSLAIALAGIHAKQHRDALMDGLDREYPDYQFAQHKGYGTQRHLEALKQFGPCAHHRRSFLGNILPAGDTGPEGMQDSLF